MGRVDVDRMLHEITSRQLLEWMAFFSSHPWGEERADLRIAQLCAITANAHSGKRGRGYTADDFMPRFEEPEPMSEDAMRSVINAFKAGSGIP